MIIYKENDIIKTIIASKGYTAESLLYLVPKGCEYKIVDETEKDYQDLSDISLNFDSALTWDLTHDIEKLKELKKEELRNYRKPLFQELDAKYMISLEMGLDPADIISEKQKLRDLPQIVDTCKTIDDLRKIEV